jgi:hypothetical protein
MRKRVMKLAMVVLAPVALSACGTTSVKVVKTSGGVSTAEIRAKGGEIIVADLVEHCCDAAMINCVVKTTRYCEGVTPISVFKFALH